MKSNRNGFTLIELMVSISILALLISLLLPSLSRAREMGRGLVCLTNLRQLSNGWHLYGDAFRDISVPMVYPRIPGGITNPANWYEIGNGKKYRPRWIATLGRYVGLFAYQQPSTSDERQDYDGQVFRCPTAAEWMDERNHAWGYNYQFLGNSRKTNDRYHHFPVNRTRLTNFASTVLGADSMGTAAAFARTDRKDYVNNGTGLKELGNHSYSLDPPRLTSASDRGTGDVTGPRTAVDPRHSGRSNVLFCDGHGESLSPEKLGYRRMADGKYIDLEPVDDPPDNKFFSGTGKNDDPPKVPR